MRLGSVLALLLLVELGGCFFTQHVEAIFLDAGEMSVGLGERVSEGRGRTL